jgi:predicted nuclease of restriction endonuclease-like RecB superfamily
LIAEVAERYQISPATVEESVYADLLEEQILTDLGFDPTPTGLVTRYNLELARGLLYWASEIRITVGGGYKDLFKYIKLFKLMHTIRPLSNGYHITLDGPISPFVNATLRYGGQMARFLPALMLCPNWSMSADIHATWLARGGPPPILHYGLDASQGYHSHYKASAQYDSRLEANFVAEFEEKFGRTDRKWILAREDEIIPVGDTVMIPDFSFTHTRDGRRALVELAGFWHPDYLKRKAWKLREAGRRDLIVVAYKSVNTTDATWQDVPGEVLLFTSKPVIKEVIAAVERSAIRSDV